MDVSIIIVNYNTISFLTDAVDSILEKINGIEYEIIVVDNNSNDNSQTILAEKYGSKTIYLSLQENIGFGRANNEGAKGRNLFFLNPDTILLNNAVKILSDYLDNNPRTGCCGGNLFDKNEKPAFSYLRYLPGIFDDINLFFLGLPRKLIYERNRCFNYTERPIKTAFISGADLMIRKELFDELQGFDPDLFMYYEDTELGYRISKKKYKIFNIPFARIIHLEGKSFFNNLDRQDKIKASWNIYLKKTHKSVSIMLMSVLSVFNIRLRLFIFTLFRNKEKIVFWKEK